MHWLYFVVSMIFLVIASRPEAPGWLVVVLVIGSLVLFLMWMLAWVSQRVGSATRDDVQMITGEELRLMRDQAEARKAAAAADAPKPDEPAA